jgi:cation transport regulator
MPNPKSKSKASKTSGKKRNSRKPDRQLSARTKKQIDSLPTHTQHIYRKTHANTIEQYQNPEKRRGGKKQSAEEVAHKAAWAAVKRDYTKKGSRWVKKE